MENGASQARRNGVVAGNGGGICVFSGGTAANFLVDVFDKIVERRQCSLNYIIPISDNGGSSSELIRVFGGPSVGDIRSRLVRLIPAHAEDEEMTALKTLFEHRLSKDPNKARVEWLDIVEARHLLWTFISSSKRELIRSVFNSLNLEIVKRARPTSVFNFAEASVGNLFLTGARIFTGSFEAGIYLLSMICSMPPTVSVLPAINSNFTHHISAGLADGTVIAGQVAISHPSAPTSLPDNSLPADAQRHVTQAAARTLPRRAELLTEAHDRIEDANLPGSLPVLRQQHITFSKDDEEDLPARIERIWYINPYGHEIWPVPNPEVLHALASADTIVYSIGSLYTSIIPSLILRGVGAAIADDRGARRKKVLILNSKIDRETGPKSQAMSAVDFVKALARAGKESQSDFSEGVQDGEVGSYVTHLIYLEGDGTPAVDRQALGRLGIECVKVEGRWEEKSTGNGILRYEEEVLTRALGEIIGC